MPEILRRCRLLHRALPLSERRECAADFQGTMFAGCGFSRGQDDAQALAGSLQKNISPVCAAAAQRQYFRVQVGRSKTRRVPTPRRKAWRTPASRHSSKTLMGVASWYPHPGSLPTPEFPHRSSHPRRASARSSRSLFTARIPVFIRGSVWPFCVQRDWIAGARGFSAASARRDFCADCVPGLPKSFRSRRHVSAAAGQSYSHRDGLGNVRLPFHLDSAAVSQKGMA